MLEQNNWRYCGKCHALFFDGYPDKGKCPADGAHEAIGYNFVLPHNIAETPNAQKDWEFCVKCNGMFFNGYPDKGKCPTGGGHQHHPEAYRFILPHNIAETPNAQKDWEFCVKCNGMFFNGYPDKGKCPAGGGHQHHPEAYRFVLPHPIHPSINLEDRFTEIFVSGSGFTPNSQVKIFYSYRDSYSFHTNGADNPLVSSTETNGFFSGATFNLTGSGTITYINVKVVDNVTNTEAVASLRGDA